MRPVVQPEQTGHREEQNVTTSRMLSTALGDWMASSVDFGWKDDDMLLLRRAGNV